MMKTAIFDKGEKSMPLAPPCPMTLDEFLALPEGPPYYEFEKGELIELPRPSIPHQDISLELSYAAKQHTRKNRLGLVVQDVEIVLPDGRVFVPDIVFVSAARLPMLMRTEKRLEGAPDLVVEIVSANAARDRVHKAKVYHKNGVSWYWIVAQKTLEIQEYRAGERKFDLVSRTARHETFKPALFPGLEIDLVKLLDAV